MNKLLSTILPKLKLALLVKNNVVVIVLNTEVLLLSVHTLYGKLLQEAMLLLTKLMETLGLTELELDMLGV